MAADEPRGERDAQRTRVFISYSRTDMAFVDRLEVALRARGIEPSIDRAEIYAFEDWWRRIQALIAKADTIVFVLSPEAVASKVCLQEVEFAASLNKRFAPIVARPVADASVPEALRRLNFIFFDDEAKLDAAADRLVEALSTDIGWIRKHTEIGELARRWAEAGRPGPKGLLLRSPVLEEAERWIATRPRNAPLPTAEALSLVAESRRAATKRQRSIVAVAVAVALLAGGLALWAEINRREATQQRVIAETNEQRAREQRDQALVTQSRFLADQALQRIQNGDSVGGMLLAAEALPDPTEPDETRKSRPYVVDAERALYASFFERRELLLMRTDTVATVIAYDPGGSRLLTASGETGATIWDAGSGEALVSLDGHEGGVRGAVFSADGTRVLTWGFDSALRVWDTSNGTAIATLSGHLRPPVAAFFMPDGRRIVSAGDASVRVWDAENGAVLHNWVGHLGRSAYSQGGSSSAVLQSTRAAMGVDPAIIDAALSPDGTRLVTTGWDGTAHVWGLDGEGLITVLHPPPSDYVGAAYTAAVSPDGGKIAVYASVAIDLVTSEDPNGFAVLRIWDAATFQQALEMKGPWGQIPGRIAFSPDGSLVALADKNRFRLFDSTTGAEVRTIEGRETIADFQFSKDGSRILSSSGLAGSAEIWDVGTGTVLTRFSGGSGARTSARFSPDEARVAMTASNGTARIWGFEPHPAAGVVLKLEGKLGDITFSPDGVLLATCALTDFPSTDAGEPDFAAARAVVTAWDVASREKVWELRDIVGGCGLAFSRDGARLAMHSYRAVKIVEARTGKTLVSIDAVTEDGGQVAFAPDDAYLVSTFPGSGANVWDAASGQHVRELAGSATVQELRFSPDGTLLALSDWDRRVRVFNFATGALRSELPAQASVVTTLAFTPDGARLVTSDGKSLRLWDAASGALVADFVRNATADGTSSGNPQKFAISPDGRRLLVDEIGELALFDLETFREIGSYKAFSGSQRGPEFTPDGTRFVLTSPPPDPSLSVVDLETLQPVLGKPLDNSLGADPYVGPDGRTIATYRLLIDYEVGLWRVFPTTGELLEAAKREVPRCLTPEERAAYYLPEVEPDWCHTLARWPFFRPRLGIKMSEREGKVILDGYFAGSLAESAGFAAGDAIVAIDGEPIKNLDRVSELVAHADSTLMFTVERAGELKEIRVSFPPR